MFVMLSVLTMTIFDKFTDRIQRFGLAAIWYMLLRCRSSESDPFMAPSPLPLPSL